MFAHLAQDSANVQMNVCGVQHLKAVVDTFFTKVQIVVFNFQSFFKVAERRPQLFGSPEYACKVIVSNCPILVAFFCQSFGLSKEFERYIEVL